MSEQLPSEVVTRKRGSMREAINAFCKGVKGLMPLAEAIEKAKDYSEKAETLPSVSRTLLAEIMRLTAELAQCNTEIDSQEEELQKLLEHIEDGKKLVEELQLRIKQLESTSLPPGDALAAALAEFDRWRHGTRDFSETPFHVVLTNRANAIDALIEAVRVAVMKSEPPAGDRSTLEAIQMALNTFDKYESGDAQRVLTEIQETVRHALTKEAPQPQSKSQQKRLEAMRQTDAPDDGAMRGVAGETDGNQS